MSKRPMLAFSLATLLLLVVIVAQICSQVVMMRELAAGRAELAAARAEVEEVRRKYGYIRVEDPKKIYIARIVDDEGFGKAYRLHIPSGHHYMLHLTDTTFPPTDFAPDDPQPTTTLSMNSWKKGADVGLSYAVYTDRDTHGVRVWTETETLFDYVLEDWVPPVGPGVGSSLSADPQKVFEPESTIQFMTSVNPETHRGVLLWMEPWEDWMARREAK